MAFSGTLVTAGTGVGVVATGAASELGRIGVLIGAVEPGATPLMRQMQGFARQLTVATLAVAVATFGVATLVRDILSTRRSWRWSGSRSRRSPRAFPP